ncbi:MAG: hypothetical protein ACM3SQ_03650, partial [Betaproteobacteria bacterium]
GMALALMIVGHTMRLAASSSLLTVTVTVIRPCTVSTSPADSRRATIRVTCSAEVARRLTVLQPAALTQPGTGAAGSTTREAASPATDAPFPIVTINF